MGLKSLRKRKKMTTYVLASALVLSNLGFAAPKAATAQVQAPQKDYTAMVEQFKKHLNIKSGEDFKLKNKIKANFNAADKVRVIVEVEGKTPVQLATEQGKLYKELSESTKSQVNAKLAKQRTTVKDKMRAKGVKFSYKNTYSTAFNGFSGEVNFGDIAKIEEVEGVKNVYLANEYKRPEEKLDMKTSKSFVQTSQTWADAGYKGEGMVVAVIDTGIDPSHKDFILTDETKADLSEEDVNALVSKEGLKGKFFTDKVPYGYNYFDQNDTILDKSFNTGMHGMHVAGIIAANGNEEAGGIKGVAPESQVLAMKVFSNDILFPSTWSDVYLAAIDDAIKLGADVLNMSLGEVASFYQEQSAEDLAIARAVHNGIVCATSAGNSNTIGFGWDNPFYKNPDIGVVEAPGIYADAISVAASGNVTLNYQHTLTLDGVEGFTGTGYGIDDWTSLTAENQALELVSLNGAYGYPEDYEGLDVAGKIVVIPRGEISFADKAWIAAEFGAAGIIVYNSEGEPLYQHQGGWDIPFMLIAEEEGAALEGAIAEGHTTAHVAKTGEQEDPVTGRMTEFSSWGTTPSLELKPEITAPGGNILSTLNNDEYGVYSGTSMAAPHVAGGSALVQQFLQNDSRFKGLSVNERTQLAKTLLMNTAKIIDDVNGQPYSPRQQGAGMMQTFNAVKTPVYVVNKSTGTAKVELKDFASPEFTMTLSAKNISAKDVTYNVITDVLADTRKENPEGEAVNALVSGKMEGVKIEAPERITVPAGQSVDLTIHVDLSEAKVPAIDAEGNKTTVELNKDMFVEGFVRLSDVDRTYEGKKELSPDLAIPYVGFYGQWDRPSILDGFKDLGESRFFDLQGMFDWEDEEGNVYEESVHDMLSDDWFLEPVPEKGVYAFSPNGDWMHEDINALPAFLRNASDVQFNVLDENKKLLRRVKMEKDVFKNYYDDGLGIPYSYNYDRTWDGKVNGKTVKDGLYHYQIKAVIDYAGAQYQTKDVPVLVDTIEPQLEAKYNEATSSVVWDTVEEGSGVKEYAIFVNGEMIDAVAPDVDRYHLTDLPEAAVVDVLAVDYAYNFGGDTVGVGDVEDAEPLVIIDPFSTMPYGAYNSKEVPVNGFIVEDLGLTSVTVNDKEVKFTQSGPGIYSFSTMASFEKDGFYDVIVKAVDDSGQASSISRKVFIDSTAPVINVEAPKLVAEKVEEVTLKINVKDNFNYLSLFVNDNHELEKSILGPIELQVPADETIDVTVPLEQGQNKITLRLRDVAGNETVKELAIQRADVNGWVREDGSWYYLKDSVKATGWVNDGSAWYYLGINGKMKTGWLQYRNKWYYLNKNGAMAVNQWVYQNHKWYYLGADGTMQTGWIAPNGKWYYLNPNGEMVIGWKLLGGKWFYFYKSGQLAVNTTINGYKLGADGAWVK